MRTSYHPVSDAFYARFAADDASVAETRETAPGVYLDLDADGQLVGVEVLGVKALGEKQRVAIVPPRQAAE
jgi:uncharacterized protein YuzE